jgi:hypothetical protein
MSDLHKPCRARRRDRRQAQTVNPGVQEVCKVSIADANESGHDAIVSTNTKYRTAMVRNEVAELSVCDGFERKIASGWRRR